MKIVVTGARGMLGADFCQFLKSNNISPNEWDLPEMDITDVNKTINRIEQSKPDIIIHFAAYTDVDGAELNKAKAYAVNTQGTWAVVLGAKETKSKLLYLSTDYVFDGQKGTAYVESDIPKPINYYGQTKYFGEKLIIEHLKRYFIVRTSWLYGKHGRNFVSTILRLAYEKDCLEVVSDQKGSPTYTRDLCGPLYNLINSDSYGIYHLTNSGACSWYEFAQEIVRQIGLDKKVIPISSDRINRTAKRPVNSILENHNYNKIFSKSMRPWNEALTDFLKEL